MVTHGRAKKLRSHINREDAAKRHEQLMTHGPTREEYLAKMSMIERWLMAGIGLTTRRRKGQAA